MSVRDCTGVGGDCRCGEGRNHRTAQGYVFKNLSDTAATEVSASVTYDAGAQGSSVLCVAMVVSRGRIKGALRGAGPLPGVTSQLVWVPCIGRARPFGPLSTYVLSAWLADPW